MCHNSENGATLQDAITVPLQVLNKKRYNLTDKAMLMYGYLVGSSPKEKDDNGVYVAEARKDLINAFRCSGTCVTSCLTQLEANSLIARRKTEFAGQTRIYILPLRKRRSPNGKRGSSIVEV